MKSAGQGTPIHRTEAQPIRAVANVAKMSHPDIVQDRYKASDLARHIDTAETVEARRRLAETLKHESGVIQEVRADGSLGAMRSVFRPSFVGIKTGWEHHAMYNEVPPREAAGTEFSLCKVHSDQTPGS